MRILKNLFALVALAIIVTACSSPREVQYLQDMDENGVDQAISNQGIIIEPGDLLSITVGAKDPELAAIFNVQPGIVSSGNGGGGGYNQQVVGSGSDVGYRVDPEGNILFPVLGTLHVAGLTRLELENLLRQRISKEGYLKEFSVSVTFRNFKISVLGDVRSPGNYQVKDEKYTLLQAIADAGDLNITGLRDVYVVREKGGTRKIYKVDLRSKSLFDSPAYYLQQNDVIYVVPNGKRVGERDNNNFRNIGMWTGLGSMALTLATFIITLTK